MHWILVIYFSAYATGKTPHFMGDFQTKPGCESMLTQMQEYQKENPWSHRDFDGKCFYVENRTK